MVCGCGMDGSLGVVVVAGEVAGVAPSARAVARCCVGCVGGRGREGVGRFRCCLVRSGFVRVVWWRAFVVESVLRSLLCGVVGVPSQV